MHRDIRETALYREAEALYRAFRQPGAGLISDAAEVCTNGRQAVFAGTVAESLDRTPPTRICLTDLQTGDTRLLTSGPNTDRLPTYSPDGRQVAFLSDRHKTGDFQLYLLDVISGAARPTPFVGGWVEYLHWSPDGRHILLGVAGHGADTAGVHGAVTSGREDGSFASWMPAVEAGNESFRWRQAWVYEFESGRVRQVSPADHNVWEVAWCGNDAIVAVASAGPSEGLWYSARLHLVDLEAGNSLELYAPQDQLGWPTGSPSGKHVAFVEALCSDRWLVAGDLRLLDVPSGQMRRFDTRGVDVTCTQWRSDRHLLVAGHRGLESVVGLCDTESGTFSEVWSSQSLSTGGLYITVSGFEESGDCVLIGESFARPPEIAVIRDGVYRAVKSFDLGDAVGSVAATVERVSWQAPDGLEIQGWLLHAESKVPGPLIMNIHGGPVWHWRPLWLGRRNAHVIMLLQRGFAIFLPNPRGSSGRGQIFARHVLGDPGGADAHDCLSGIDFLVRQGIADPNRLGVTGLSYGGFLTSWLVTQNPRFAAAVAVSPHTNFVTYHLVSNIPEFVSLFLADTYTNPGGKYFLRSPIVCAHKASTPTLNICGALDRCTPSEEAVQFHNALVEDGIESTLVIYPEEGHGVRRFPALIDYAARVVAWFDEHMGAPI